MFLPTWARQSSGLWKRIWLRREASDGSMRPRLSSLVDFGVLHGDRPRGIEEAYPFSLIFHRVIPMPTTPFVGLLAGLTLS